MMRQSQRTNGHRHAESELFDDTGLPVCSVEIIFVGCRRSSSLFRYEERRLYDQGWFVGHDCSRAHSTWVCRPSDEPVNGTDRPR